MNPPAFLLATATSQPTKPNTRIPPILAAGKASNLNPATSTTTTAEPPFSRLATLSKQKLFAEAATGDPDLRRCLGHHRLLTRSLDEAKEDMKRYLDEVLESESDDDEEDLFVEYELRKRGVLFQEDEFADDEDDDECLTVEEAEVVVPSTSTSVAPAPAPATISRAQLPTPVSSPALATRSVPLCNSTTTNPAPVWMKEKIVGAVRGLVRRRNSASLPPPPGTSTPVPSPSTTSPPAAAAPKKEPQSTLTHVASKNASCSQIPVYLHIYDHPSKPARTLERSQSQSQLQSQAQGQGRSITMRGRQYAKRLGLKVTAAVPVAT